MNFELDIQFFGRGRSKGGGGGGGGANPPQPQPQPQPANTPSGVTYDQFMQMTDTQKYQVMDNIINDPNIQVPSYLDDSATSKVMYALGMDNKPTVVSDSQLDTMQGREIYRTVYEKGTMPPPSTDMITDQIRNGDYTQMSGYGGSAHGRAIYFATDFTDSTAYGAYERNAMVLRGKINQNAVIRSERSLANQIYSDNTYTNSQLYKTVHNTISNHADNIALYALSHGIDGWYSSTYTMIVNRKNLTLSDLNKRITKINTSKPSSTTAKSWQQAANAH